MAQRNSEAHSETSFVLIGQVDAGKSTISGRLLYMTGQIDDHEMQKIIRRAESDGMSRWRWARVLDIYEEEAARGKTHEHAVINFSYNGLNYNLIDTPGHQSFVRAMISGISSTNPRPNVACVVVSMIPNEFRAGLDGGMLKEHMTLARAVGLEHMVLLANKMDVIDWDRELYQRQTDIVLKFAKKLGWKTTTTIPISGYDGIGLLNGEGWPSWQTGGRSLIDALVETSGDSVISKDTDHRIVSRTRVKVKILSCPSIICAGYQCIGHIDGKEHEITFDRIAGRKFIKEGDTALIGMSFEPDASLRNNDCRIILRKDAMTIGFGRPME